MVRLVGVRLLQGVLTLALVSVLVFFATQVLPGNAAHAALGQSVTPERLKALEAQLGLDRPLLAQYWDFISGLLTGHPGTSLATKEPLGQVVGPALVNSAVLVLLAGVFSTVIGVGLGVTAAARRDSWLDHGLSTFLLIVTALPEFVVALALIIVFSTLVLQVLPAVSTIAPGASPFSDPVALILPVATLVLVAMPYAFRMARSATIDALQSEYVEMANLKGLESRRVLFVHALTNALPPVIQVVGLNLLYLAGGIVVVEYVFNYQGLGYVLVTAVTNRDITVIQVDVLLLAAFYVLINIASDVAALAATPRRRLSRTQ